MFIFALYFGLKFVKRDFQISIASNIDVFICAHNMVAQLISSNVIVIRGVFIINSKKR